MTSLQKKIKTRFFLKSLFRLSGMILGDMILLIEDHTRTIIDCINIAQFSMALGQAN